MNFIEKALVSALEKALESNFEFTAEPGMVMLEIPQRQEQGDYATNIAMRLTKVLKRNPREIATALVSSLTDLDIIDKVEIAGPGFINFFVKPSVLAQVIETVLTEDKDYGRLPNNGKKILVEYVSANPTGQLHVGHARGAAWGDSLTRILTYAGYNVLREFYVNDLGNQITMLSHSLYARYQQAFGIEATLPEDGYHGSDIVEIASDVKNQEGDKWLDKDQTAWEPYFKELGIEFELKRIEKDLKTFRVSFDSWVSEKSLYDEGRVEKTLNALKASGDTYESEGALWFSSTKYGDDKDRVLIKSDGSYTYLVPDIANHLFKLERGYQHLLNLWGGDHHGYIPRMKAALESFGYHDVLEVDIIQMVRLIEDGAEVKMSKRTGNAIGLVELSDDIGVDAARYFFVSRSLQTPLDFDLNLARSKTNENPVYYAQYAHARIESVIQKVGSYDPVKQYDGLTHVKETELLKQINEFSNAVNQAANARNVQIIPNYIQDLSQMLHSYYGEVKINDPENMDITAQRVDLLKAVQITLRNALDLIGVSAPKSM